MFSKKFLVVILFLAVASQIRGDGTVRSDIKGRLLTPEEGCGLSKIPNNRIVGGVRAKNGAWPWLVLLGRKIESFVFFSCGGSLITSRHVLSATHCFIRNYNFVRLGEYDTLTTDDGEHIDVGIARIETHKNYTIYLKLNDVAIVYLEHDIDFTDRIRPICIGIPSSENMHSRSFVGSMPFIAGWGHLQEHGKMTNILQQVQLPVIENSECKEKYVKLGLPQKYAEIRFNGSNVLCAGFTLGGKDACQGDSGGPMMLPIHENGRFPFYQIGIVSYGLGCGRPNTPGVYTDVQTQLDWIKEKLY